MANIWILILLALSMAVSASAMDSDRDGLSDRLEQELLEKFAPRLMLSRKECAGLPAKFRPGFAQPQLLAKDGTVYGQVFQTAPVSGTGIYAEIHYYHLWDRDCGRLGHPLDVEHVSALVWALSADEPAAAWEAQYWYAAAHEDTTCDASHGVQSHFIHSEDTGPTIWISAGKHASFLNQDLCRGGCGGDNCGDMYPSAISELINLGEPDAPMNEAVWIASPDWPLAEKMKTDFPAPVLAKLVAASTTGVTPISNSPAPVKIVIHAGGDTVGSQATAVRKTGAGLSVTTDAVGTSLQKSSSGAGSGLKRVARSVWRALGGSREQKPAAP
jgi:hypothetical protein